MDKKQETFKTHMAGLLKTAAAYSKVLIITDNTTAAQKDLCKRVATVSMLFTISPKPPKEPSADLIKMLDEAMSAFTKSCMDTLDELKTKDELTDAETAFVTDSMLHMIHLAFC